MLNSRLVAGLGVAAALAGLAGCAKIRYPDYYLLNAPAPRSPSSRTPHLGPVAVRQFASPEFLRQGAIVYRGSPERVDFYHYHRWAADPRRAVTDAMINEIRSRGAFQSVAPYDGGSNGEWIVSGTLDHLEEVDEGADVWIEVAVSAQLKSMRTGEVLWENTSTKRAKLDQRSVPGVVAAMSREMGNVVEVLVTGMLDRLSPATPAESRVR